MKTVEATGPHPLPPPGFARRWCGSSAGKLLGNPKRYNGPANPDHGDLWAAVFSPALVDNSDTSSIYGANSMKYRANKSLDTNRDGVITRNELTARADEWYERGMEGLV